MKKISLFSVKRCQSKTVRFVTSSNDVKPPDQHRYKTRDLPSHNRLFWNPISSVNETIAQMIKDTTSAGVKTGLAVMLFFCAGISPAVAVVDRYQSSVFEDEIIECYARMAAAAYNDIPDLKNRITCDSRKFSDNNDGPLRHMTWHYTDFQEIYHEYDWWQINGGQSITDVYERCDGECNSETATVKELVFAFRGTENKLDQVLDGEALTGGLITISNSAGGIVVGPSDNQYNFRNPIELFITQQHTLMNHSENDKLVVAFDKIPYGPFDPQQFPLLDQGEDLWSGYQSALDPAKFKLPRGFKERADSHWPFLKEKLDKAIEWAREKKGQRKLYVRTTGHSLGGSQASIMALYALMYIEQVRQADNSNLSEYFYSVEAFPFTPPRTMPEQMAKLTQALLRHPYWAKFFKMHIFSNDRDPVARAPHTIKDNWGDNVYHPVPENFVAGPHDSEFIDGNETKHYVAHVKHDSAYDAYLTIGLDPYGTSEETLYHNLGLQQKHSINQSGSPAWPEWRKMFPMPPKGPKPVWPVNYMAWAVSDATNMPAFLDRAHGITQFFKGHWSDQGTPTQRYYTTRMMDEAYGCREYDVSAGCRQYHGSSIVTYEDGRLGDQNLPRIADWHRVEGNVSLKAQGMYLIRSASDTSLCLTADFDSGGKVSFRRCASGAALLHQIVRVHSTGKLHFPYSTVAANSDDQMCLHNTTTEALAKPCRDVHGYGALGDYKKWEAKLDKRGFATIISGGNSQCLSGNGDVHEDGDELSVRDCVNNQSDSQAIASQAFLIEPAVQHHTFGDVRGKVLALASKAKQDLSCLKANLEAVAIRMSSHANTSECEFIKGNTWAPELNKRFERQHALQFLHSSDDSPDGRNSQSPRYFTAQGAHRKRNSDGSDKIIFYCFVPTTNASGASLMVRPNACREITNDNKFVMPIMTPSGSLMLFVNPNREDKKYYEPQLCWDSPEMTALKRNVGTKPNRGQIKLRGCSYNRNNFAVGKPSNVEWYAGRSFTDYYVRKQGETANHKVAVPVQAKNSVHHGTNGTPGADHCAVSAPAGSTTVPFGQSANGEPSPTSDIYQEPDQEIYRVIHPIKTLVNASYTVYSNGPVTVTPKNEFIVTAEGATSNCNHNRVLHQTIEYGVTDEFGNEAKGTIEHYMTDNLAYGKPAKQSSHFGANSKAEKAVDGNKSSDYDQLSVASTAKNDVDPWWEVNLTTLSKVRNVRLYNYALTGTGDSALPKASLSSFIVEALSPTREVIERSGYGGVVNDYVDLPMTADGVMYVRITLPYEGMLQLNEVEVAGWEDEDLRSTPPKDDGNGNSVYLDRHLLSCGTSGISQFQLKRQGSTQIYYDYECSVTASTDRSLKMTAPNVDGGGDTRYLDRHAISCNNKPIKAFKLYRNGQGNKVRYRYQCGSQTLFDSTTYYTSWDTASNKSWYLDRHNVECPSGQVLSFVRPQTNWGENKMRYKFICGSPFD